MSLYDIIPHTVASPAQPVESVGASLQFKVLYRLHKVGDIHTRNSSKSVCVCNTAWIGMHYVTPCCFNSGGTQQPAWHNLGEARYVCSCGQMTNTATDNIGHICTHKALLHQQREPRWALIGEDSVLYALLMHTIWDRKPETCMTHSFKGRLHGFFYPHCTKHRVPIRTFR